MGNVYSRMRYEGDGKVTAADAMRSVVAPTFGNGVDRRHMH